MKTIIDFLPFRSSNEILSRFWLTRVKSGAFVPTSSGIVRSTHPGAAGCPSCRVALGGARHPGGIRPQGLQGVVPVPPLHLLVEHVAEAGGLGGTAPMPIVGAASVASCASSRRSVIASKLGELRNGAPCEDGRIRLSPRESLQLEPRRLGLLAAHEPSSPPASWIACSIASGSDPPAIRLLSIVGSIFTASAKAVAS